MCHCRPPHASLHAPPHGRRTERPRVQPPLPLLSSLSFDRGGGWRGVSRMARGRARRGTPGSTEASLASRSRRMGATLCLWYPCGAPSTPAWARPGGVRDGTPPTTPKGLVDSAAREQGEGRRSHSTYTMGGAAPLPCRARPRANARQRQGRHTPPCACVRPPWPPAHRRRVDGAARPAGRTDTDEAASKRPKERSMGNNGRKKKRKKKKIVRRTKKQGGSTHLPPRPPSTIAI